MNRCAVYEKCVVTNKPFRLFGKGTAETDLLVDFKNFVHIPSTHYSCNKTERSKLKLKDQMCSQTAFQMNKRIKNIWTLHQKKSTAQTYLWPHFGKEGSCTEMYNIVFVLKRTYILVSNVANLFIFSYSFPNTILNAFMISPMRAICFVNVISLDIWRQLNITNNQP